MARNDERWVLVTGSSRGIGRAIACRLADAGFHIVVHCRGNVDAARETMEAVTGAGAKTRMLQFDVCDRAHVAATLEADMASHGAYYGVVCNAGITADVAFPAMTDAQWDDVVTTSLHGFYNVLRPTVMPMIRRRDGGRIVTIASVSGLMGNRGQVNYSAAKSGIMGATKALALELAKRSITVNCVAPGLIDTDIVGGEVPVEELLKVVPMRRMGRPEEVAGVVGFLFSSEASYVTRQVISVNGGLI